jgi:hypothetical protein
MHFETHPWWSFIDGYELTMDLLRMVLGVDHEVQQIPA